MASGNYAQTYWSSKGNHQELEQKLAALIPSQGEVNEPDKNPALERFRVASNCYYDLYNNGLGNRGKEFVSAFGFAAHRDIDPDDDSDDQFDRGLGDDEFDQELIDRVEKAMDLIILTAAAEQKLGPEGRYQKALEAIASLWPEPGQCAALVPEHVGPNDGRMRADLLFFALNAAREALGKPPYPRPAHWQR